MTGLAYFRHRPLRAIEVRPVDAEGSLWQAHYAGDQWTPAMRFEPPMQFATLRDELWRLKERRGLPIVIEAYQPSEVAA